jgi:hypothetical protein
MTVTPTGGANSFVTTGGTAVIAASANSSGYNGGYITNPLLASDQGIGTAEPLIVDPTGASPGLNANGTAIALQPGQTWNLITGQVTATMVNATTSNHKFTVIVY